MPLDTQVVEWLAELLAAISIDAGYYTDAGQTVVTEGLHLLAEDMGGIVLAVEDVAETVIDQSRMKRQAELTLECQALAPVDAVSARATVRAALADMRRALAQARRRGDTFPPGVTSLAIGSRSLERREESADLLTGALTVTVKYTERYEGDES